MPFLNLNSECIFMSCLDIYVFAAFEKEGVGWLYRLISRIFSPFFGRRLSTHRVCVRGRRLRAGGRGDAAHVVGVFRVRRRRRRNDVRRGSVL